MNPLSPVRGSGVLLAACVALSCAPSRPALDLGGGRDAVGALLEGVRAHGEQIRSLVGSGSVSFESPEGAGDLFFSLTLQRPDSLLVQLEGPFGIDVGFLFLSRERYVLYNSLENRVFEGIPRTEALRRLIPVDLTPGQIVETFSGIIPVPAGPEEVLGYWTEDDLVKLVTACGGDTCSYWIDPASLLVRRHRRVDAGGRLLQEVETGNVIEEEGLAVPKRIRIAFPGSGRQLAILYSRLSINVDSPSFAFSVPRDARSSIR